MNKHLAYVLAGAAVVLLIASCAQDVKSVPPSDAAQKDTQQEPPLGGAFDTDATVQLDNPEDAQHGHGTPQINGVRDSVVMGVYNTPPAPSLSSGATTGAASAGASR